MKSTEQTQKRTPAKKRHSFEFCGQLDICERVPIPSVQSSGYEMLVLTPSTSSLRTGFLWIHTYHYQK